MEWFLVLSGGGMNGKSLQKGPILEWSAVFEQNKNVSSVGCPDNVRCFSGAKN